MPDSKHSYKNSDITVVWRPSVCIHSAICFKGLPEVFDPRRRPWIEMDKSDSATIIDQVNKCPSGALSFYMNEEMKEGL